ncbi:MAG: tRNA threonylcarbamoyladenosine dehydratase [Christensenellales bacterium]|jgi:tRNA A37 threonylcarbamoyladenosine dehydratase
MLNEFSRTELLLGADAMEKLRGSRVAVFGIGGVGSYATEALARSGVGYLRLIDDDCICITNINRQIHALHSTIGNDKAETMKSRVLDINPKAEVEAHKVFYLPGEKSELIDQSLDYVLDAVDTVTAKLAIAEQAARLGVPLISCMGAGNKLDPTRLEVADIYQTSVCPLCKVMRNELRKRSISSLKTVYSREQPIKPLSGGASCSAGCVCPPTAERKCTERRQIPGSVSFVPSVAGLIMASEVIKDLVK